jgi:hypothetical protein
MRGGEVLAAVAVRGELDVEPPRGHWQDVLDGAGREHGIALLERG